MNRTEVLEAIRTAAVEILQVEPDQVTESAAFSDDLDADSLDVVELVMALEDTLGIAVPEEDLEEVRTVGDALDVIVAKLAVKA
ncbi:MAG TPA: acyl carrier protein [Acidimicrobiales bacterium]|jgi:acyl carrier protein